MKTLRSYALLSVFLISTASGLRAQLDTANAGMLNELSLQELLEVKVVSVSKNSELLFDAPLSASVITKEEIKRAGATSLMEALRLIPGIIVREQTNGNYDIYIRGMDNVPANSAFEGNSTTALVMLNNRPIYNYLKGGTFWETIPADINDVEKIEVIRGPAAALYGPNALSGIINIITRNIDKQGFHSTVTTRAGSNATYIGNASIGYRFNPQWSLLATGNYQGRERSQTSHYEIFRDQWLTDPEYMISYVNDTVHHIGGIYPHPKRAMKKYAGNVYLNYDPNSATKLYLSAGAQHSFAQRVSTDNGKGPLSSVASDSRYADLRAQVNAITAQVSYNEGTQVPDHQPGNQYDFSSLDMNMEYAFTRDGLSIKPGLSYRSAVYNDTRYADPQRGNSLFNERAVLTTASGSLRTEYQLMNHKIRLVAGMMANRFNYPDTTYLSYELAATWKLHKKHMVRAVYSTSPRSSNVYDSYVNQRIALFPIGQNRLMQLQVEANRELKLLTAAMLEVGYRGALGPRFTIDAEFFSIRSKNYSSMMAADPYSKLEGRDTVIVYPYRTTNLPMTLLQHGMTVSVHYNGRRFQAKSSVTVQQSDMKDYSPYMNTSYAMPLPGNPNPGVNNLHSGLGTSTPVKSTPRFFGNAYFNYMPTPKWTLNISTYFYASQVYFHASNAVFHDGVKGIDHIDGKCLVNVNIAYQVLPALQVSGGVRNLLNNRSREFFKTDVIPVMLLAGLQWEFRK